MLEVTVIELLKIVETPVDSKVNGSVLKRSVQYGSNRWLLRGVSHFRERLLRGVHLFGFII
ncbi:hypothetical protein L3i20_v222230 [Paenibacillus sp. L3-i20]|nr:hypothetical protein L3i20_v222230 [Paenibacillus sp. L3-i20]